MQMLISPEDKSIYSHGNPSVGRFLPGRIPNVHANVEPPSGEIPIFHANVDFSLGEIHLFPWAPPMGGFLPGRDPNIHANVYFSPARRSPPISCKCGSLPWRNPFIPMGNPPCKCGLLHGRNPHSPCKCGFPPGRNQFIPMGSPPIGGFLPGRNPDLHANVDFSLGEIHIFHANVDFSPGEINLFTLEIPHWWISPREKSKHTCKC